MVTDKNHWYVKGWCYWEKELSKDEGGNVWINVGWQGPLLVTQSLTKTLAVSAYTYAHRFN